MILEPDDFYIFASRELVRLPPEYCAEMVPFDAGSGEVRTRLRGFLRFRDSDMAAACPGRKPRAQSF